MSVLVRVLTVLRTIVNKSVAGVRWLARQTSRQRSLGVSQGPQVVRLLDLHAITIAAQVALVAGLLVARGSLSLFLWLLALLVGVVLVGAAMWRSSRLLIGLLIGAQGIASVIAAQWEWRILPLILVTAIAQQTALAVVWMRNAAPLAALARATAYGLMLGVFSGGIGLVVGLFAPAFPLWIAAILFTVAAIMSAKVPDPGPKPRVPRQGASGTPKGFSVYRPSSLDDTKP